MKSITELAGHKYIEKRCVARTIFGADTNANYERLRSRIKGRHRYTENEYLMLAKYFKKLSNKLKKLNYEKFITPKGNFRRKAFFNSIPECIKIKPVIEETDNYFRIYDQFRRYKKVKEEYLKEFFKKLQDFAELIDKNLEEAKKEARRYNFSYGRGQVSHL